MFLPRLNSIQIKQTKEAVSLPEGTIEFRHRSPKLFDTEISTGVLVQAICGKVREKLFLEAP